MLDFTIAKAINEFGRGTILDNISYLISVRSFLFILLALLVIIIFKFDNKRWKKIIIALAITMVLYFVINEVVIKDFWESTFLERVRPYLAYPNEIIPIGHPNVDSSFPSSHMSALTGVLLILAYYYRKYWIWIASILIILVMGLSRVHNGMHYPSDVLAGIIFGLVFGFIAIWTSEKISGKRKKRAKVKKRR
jgi:undecaprenyl-diphosphatase